MHMTPNAKPAWEQLTAAMEHTIPDCENDDRYIADILENGAKKELGLICTACPLLQLCMNYALEDRPRGGWWPGHNLKNIERKKIA